MRKLQSCCRSIVSTAFLLVQFSAASAEIPDLQIGQGPSGLDQVKFWTSLELKSSEYASVDEAIARYGDLKIRSRDGIPALAGVQEGIRDFCKEFALDNTVLEHIRKWRKESPASIAAILTEACIWKEAAWAARGPGFASDVSELGWKLFHKRLGTAESLLRASRDTAAATPIWYAMYMDVTVGMNSPTMRDAIFREGAERFPEYYPLYFNFLWLKLPQWSGSQSSAGETIDAITRGGKTPDDAARYSRMYWYVSQNAPDVGGRMLSVVERGANWQIMKRGFLRIQEQFPGSDFNTLNFMSFACKQGDGDAYLSWRKLLVDERYAADAINRQHADIDVYLCDQKYRPMGDINQRYEAAILGTRDFNIDIIMGCRASPRTEASEQKILTAFTGLLEHRAKIFAMEENEHAESSFAIDYEKGALEAIDKSDPRAICKKMTRN